MARVKIDDAETREVAAELRKIERAYQKAVRRAEELREERNRVLLKAIEAGMSHAQIAKETGLTRARVGQLALQRDR